MALNTLTKFVRRNDLSVICSYSAKYLTVDNIVFNSLKHARFSYSAVHKQNVTKNIQLRNITALRFYSATKAQSEIEDYRNDNNVTIIGQDIPSPYIDIENCEFPDYVKKFIKQQGITKPTAIQSQGWPIAISGQNFVGIAQTGTGKTLAYLLPAVVHLKEKMVRKGKGPVVLVLAPTRELARQIEEVAKEFEQTLQIRCACIYGGANKARQAALLEQGVDIVIATPGRLNDFLNSKVTTLSRCTYVVLDEADRMLDMGFEPQIRECLEGVPYERQMLMFSATWPKEVQTLAKEYLGEFVQVNVGSTELTANHNIEQHIHICEQHEKLELFKKILHDISGDGFGKLLVFTNTKKFVDHLANALSKNGWPANGIHGDKTQVQRDRIINRFKKSKQSILIATDVAARGLDVDGITHVINYDFPNTTEDYIHRIGRTGRQQNKGVSHTILTSEDGRQANSLIAVLKEAKQEIPKELDDLARSYLLDKSLEKQEKYKSRSFRNNYDNKFSSKYGNKYGKNYGSRSGVYNKQSNYNRNYNRNRFDEEMY